MHLTRRQFTALLAGAIPALSSDAKRIPVAIQLFSLRRQCEQDLEATLAYVRQVGFDGVEFAGFYGKSAAELRDLLRKYSLRCCGSHTTLPQLTGANLQTTVEFNRTLGNRYLIIPGLPKEYEASASSWKAAAELLNRIADQLRPFNMRVGYHNHDVEFRPVDGLLPWQILYESTQPEVILQLDMGNARIAGADPASLIRQFPGRAATVHVKDYLPTKTDPVLGASEFDWGPFLKISASRGGTEWYVIEHDSPDQKETGLCLQHFRALQAAV